MSQSNYRSKSNQEQAEAAARALEATPTSASRLTPEDQVVLLEHVSQSGNLRAAAALVGTTQQAVRELARRDPSFADEMQAAWADFRDGILMVEAHRRAVDGVEEGIYYRGVPTTDEHGRPAKLRHHSDTLLIRLLEVHDPRFRPHSVQEVKHSQPELDLEKLTPEQRAKLEALLEALRPKENPPAGVDAPGQDVI
jgi:Spy/CpxP family protein refolding chaperone